MPAGGPEASATDLLLEGFATRAAAGYLASVPLFRRAVAMLRADDLSPQESLGGLGLGCHCRRRTYSMTRPSTHWPFAGSNSPATMAR